MTVAQLPVPLLVIWVEVPVERVAWVAEASSHREGREDEAARAAAAELWAEA